MGGATTRLTEKRMADRRFRKNEERILRAFVNGDNYISAETMAKRAKVARSTFYRHHKTVGMIIPDYRKYILGNYSRAARKMNKNKASLKIAYLMTLSFISHRRNVFQILMKCVGREMIVEMVQKLNPKVIKYAKLPKNNTKMLRVYNSEITELIFEWINKGSSEEEIENLLDEIMLFSGTIRERLGKIR